MKLSFAHFALALSAQFLQADAFGITTVLEDSRASSSSCSSKVLAFAQRSGAAASASPCCLYATIDTSDATYLNYHAADDGGQKPSKEEQAAIDDAIMNIIIPEEAETYYLENEEAETYESDSVQVAFIGMKTNAVLFRGLKRLRDGVSMADPVDLNENIDFVAKKDVRKCMFFDIKYTGVPHDLGIGVFQQLLRMAPALDLDADKELMTPADYEEIYGNKAIPLDVMMEVDCPLKCFLENAPAFCKPIEGEEHKTLCDLDYLTTYQVRVGTPYRYGGRAIVEHGDIVEISGVKKGEAGFDTKLHVFLSSFAVHVVLVRHAIMGHLAMYQKYMMKLTVGRSAAYKDLWNKNKTPNVLMKALTPRATNKVNFNIQLLIGPHNSLVGRATSFTNESIMHLNINKYNEYYAMDPDTMVEYIGKQGSKGWKSACQESWKAAQEVVNILCRDIKDSNELKQHDLRDLAMLLWTGTFFHGFIGDFQLDNVNKGNLPFPVTGEKHHQSVAYGTLSTTIGATTAQRTMDMNTLSKFFNKEDRNAWKEYQETLTECAEMTGINGFSYNGHVYNAIDF